MPGIIKKWRNSVAIRIPTAVLDAAHLRLGQPVNVREENGRIVIEPLRPTHDGIDALVAAITDENRHDPVDMGPPVGKEVC